MPVPTPPDDFEAGVDGDDDELESVGEEEAPDSEPETAKKRRSSKGRRKSTGGHVSSSKQPTKKPAKDSIPSKRKSIPTAEPGKPGKKAKVEGKKRKRNEKEEEDKNKEEASLEAMDDVQEEPPVLRRRKAARTRGRDGEDGDVSERLKDLQEKLEDANQSIATLKRRLRKRESQLASMTNMSEPVRVVAPAAPENLAVPKRLASKTHSNAVNADEFAKMYGALQDSFTAFKKLVFAADASRSSLDRETKDVQEKFAKLISDVKNTEHKAAEQEKLLCRQLTELLEGDVALAALRAHKAGNFVKSMGKTCKGMPLISHLCAEIRSKWLLQVKTFMTEQSATQENGEAAGKGMSESVEREVADSNSTDSAMGKGEASKDGTKKPTATTTTGDAVTAKGRAAEAGSRADEQMADVEAEEASRGEALEGGKVPAHLTNEENEEAKPDPTIELAAKAETAPDSPRKAKESGGRTEDGTQGKVRADLEMDPHKKTASRGDGPVGGRAPVAKNDSKSHEVLSEKIDDKTGTRGAAKLESNGRRQDTKTLSSKKGENKKGMVLSSPTRPQSALHEGQDSMGHDTSNSPVETLRGEQAGAGASSARTRRRQALERSRGAPPGDGENAAGEEKKPPSTGVENETAAV
ncbi:unnamed protein product [Chondrus crispus]|uniref:Uncharacterized protein n=1 Tax=Chondrus crispus TaxID=2769 RepID=R7Q8U0_CHOCR|nr:unnamed protein product [Chondrus crispus]CDF34454.1 unnamed protein product [Chondrus crispus]|eukprot:XP_005714273.1 unnamed protein product [Chondrus crispus]